MTYKLLTSFFLTKIKIFHMPCLVVVAYNLPGARMNVCVGDIGDTGDHKIMNVSDDIFWSKINPTRTNVFK